MQHLRTLDQVNLDASCVTIGTYDGVHLGHQVIIRRLVQDASAMGLPSVVITFYPSPAVVLRGVAGRHCLTDPEERAALFGDLGVDVVATLAFSRDMAAQTAEEFMTSVQRQTGLRALWVGYDFALGRNRQGNLAELQRLGGLLGYGLKVVPEFLAGDRRPSSSLIDL